MPKKRERRIPAVRERQIPAKQLNPTSIFYLTLIFLVVALILYRYLNTSQINSYLTVYERGLVKPDITFQEVVAENSKSSANTTRKHFQYPILAYVTPWNSKGYDIAKKFSSKFTHISPVWYELKSEGTNLVLDGRHNSDIAWVAEVRENGYTLVLPRVVLEVFPKEFLRKRKRWDKAIDLIVSECKDMGYDGIVLESWSRWASYGILHDPSMRSTALQFIHHLALALHSVSSTWGTNHQLQLIYVIPAPHAQELQEYDFGPKDLESLSEDIDGFSLMTYDFSTSHSPGPNAPLYWLRSSLQMFLGDVGSNARAHAYKIFLGINFYGNDFLLSQGSGGGAITGREYLSLLEQQRPILQWKGDIAEHFFIYSDNNRNKHAVFYPSLLSISIRLDEARSWGAGVSIWEIGQGLDYFFDLL